MHSASSGPWSDQQLLQTVADYGGVGSDANQPPKVRFLRGVAKVVRKRLKIATEMAVEPAVFLLCPVAPETVSTTTLIHHPMLDNGLTPVEGRFWFVNPVVVSGKSMPLNTSEDSAMFEFVVDSLGQGQVPAVIYDPRVDPAQLRYYPTGLQDADACEVIDILVDVVDIKRILHVIDRLCDRQLVTPDAQSLRGKLWEKPDRHWPIRDAELTIQMYLVTAFSAAFPACTIREEQPQTTGRLDIEIEETDPSRPGHVIRHALLELKVLRSYGSTGNNISSLDMKRWVSEGIDQAYSYRIERGTLQSALCCFDMRKSHEDLAAFEEVAEKARRLEVVVRRWSLYASSKAYRESMTGLN